VPSRLIARIVSNTSSTLRRSQRRSVGWLTFALVLPYRPGMDRRRFLLTLSVGVHEGV
jgi:hypothetical protein